MGLCRGRQKEEESPTGDTARVLEAISLCQCTLTAKIEEVKVDISLIRQDIHKLKERVSENKHRVGHVEAEIPPLQVTTERLQYQLNAVLRRTNSAAAISVSWVYMRG